MNRLIALIVVLIVVLGAGLSRLQLDADVFNLLPRNSPAVSSLQSYQKNFGASNELLILVRGETPESALAATEQLAEELAGSPLVANVVWRNPLEHDREALGELIAYLWLNQPAREFAALEERFAPGAVARTLDETVERMAVSFRPEEVARLGNDPFNLTGIADKTPFPVVSAADDPFASADGRARILLLSPAGQLNGFRPVRAWVQDIQALLDGWQAQQDASLSIGVTGAPAFLVESGSALIGDVQIAAVSTLVVVGLLFWFAHRRFRPLLWLTGLLTLVLAVTAVAGAFIFGALHAIALGFAAILLGLAADYGLVLYQESVTHPDESIHQHRMAAAPAILWSSLTTAGAFFLIGRSSLPGLTQLGVLVGLGILVAAAVMLLAFLPLSGKANAAGARRGELVVFRMRARAGAAAAVVLALVSMAVLAWRAPAVDTDVRSLELGSSESRRVLEDISADIGGFEDELWLLVSGESDQRVRDRLMVAAPLLEAAATNGVLAGYNLPTALWPDPLAQRANKETLQRLVSRWPAAETAALEQGFVAEALAIDRAVFSAWAGFDPAAGTVWPESPAATWAFGQFAAVDANGSQALGRLRPAAGVDQQQLLELAGQLSAAGAGQLASWGLLADSLLGAMKQDIRRVLIPMSIALLVLLIAAFRKLSEVLLSLATMLLSLLVLLAVMSVLGWSWNLMNVMALPMLFGAGVDYGLHILFAMRRYNGDAIAARNNVGRAILLCAGSTAAGFATLGFANNAGMASLGRVCAAGVLITALVSVFLLPAWWQIIRRQEAT